MQSWQRWSLVNPSRFTSIRPQRAINGRYAEPCSSPAVLSPPKSGLLCFELGQPRQPSAKICCTPGGSGALFPRSSICLLVCALRSEAKSVMKGESVAALQDRIWSCGKAKEQRHQLSSPYTPCQQPQHFIHCKTSGFQIFSPAVELALRGSRILRHLQKRSCCWRTRELQDLLALASSGEDEVPVLLHCLILTRLQAGHGEGSGGEGSRAAARTMGTAPGRGGSGVSPMGCLSTGTAAGLGRWAVGE